MQSGMVSLVVVLVMVVVEEEEEAELKNGTFSLCCAAVTIPNSG